MWTAISRITSGGLIDHEVLVEILLTCQMPIDFFDCAMNIPLPSYQPLVRMSERYHTKGRKQQKQEEEEEVPSETASSSSPVGEGRSHAPPPLSSVMPDDHTRPRTVVPTASDFYSHHYCWPLQVVDQCQEYVQLVQQIRLWLQWQFTPGNSASRWLPLPPSALTTAVSTGVLQLPPGLTAGQALHYLHHQMALVCAYRALVIPAPVESRLRRLWLAIEKGELVCCPPEGHATFPSLPTDVLDHGQDSRKPPILSPPPLLLTSSMMYPLLQAYGLAPSLYDGRMMDSPSPLPDPSETNAPTGIPPASVTKARRSSSPWSGIQQFWRQRFYRVVRQWSTPSSAEPAIRLRHDHHHHHEAHRMVGEEEKEEEEKRKKKGAAAAVPPLPPVVERDAVLLWHRLWPHLFVPKTEIDSPSLPPTAPDAPSPASSSVFSFTVLPLSLFQPYFFCGSHSIVFRRDRLYREEWERNGACGDGGTRTTTASPATVVGRGKGDSPFPCHAKREKDGWGWLGELVYGQYGLGVFPFQLPPLRQLGLSMVDVARITVAWVTDTCARVGTSLFLASVPLGTFVSTFLLFSEDALLEAIHESPLAILSTSCDELRETRCRVEALLLISIIRCAGAERRLDAASLSGVGRNGKTAPPALGIALSTASTVLEAEISSLPCPVEKYVQQVVETMRAPPEAWSRWSRRAGGGTTRTREGEVLTLRTPVEGGPSHSRSGTPSPKKGRPPAAESLSGAREWYAHDPFLLCVSRCIRLWTVLTEEERTLCISDDTWKEVIQLTRVFDRVDGTTEASEASEACVVPLIPFRLSMLTSLPGGCTAPTALSTTVEEYILEATGMDFARVHRLHAYFAEKRPPRVIEGAPPQDTEEVKEEEEEGGKQREAEESPHGATKKMTRPREVHEKGPDTGASSLNYWQLAELLHVCGVPDLFASTQHFYEVLQQEAQLTQEKRILQQIRERSEGQQESDGRRRESARYHGGGSTSFTSRERMVSSETSRHSSISSSSSSTTTFPSGSGGGYNPFACHLSRYTSSYLPPRVWPWIKAEGQWNREAFDTLLRLPLKAMWESLTRKSSTREYGRGEKSMAPTPTRADASRSPSPVSPHAVAKEKGEDKENGLARATKRRADPLSSSPESGDVDGDTSAEADLFDQVGFFIALLSVVEQLLVPLLSRLPLFWDSSSIPRLDFLSVLPPNHARHAASSLGTHTRLSHVSLSPSSHLRHHFSPTTSTASTPERDSTPEGSHFPASSPPREEDIHGIRPARAASTSDMSATNRAHRGGGHRPPSPLCLSGTRAVHAYLTSLMDMLEFVSSVHHHLELDSDATAWQLEKLLPLSMMKADTVAFRSIPTGLWERLFLFLSLLAETPKRIQVLTTQYMRLLHLIHYFMSSSPLQVEGIPVQFFSVYMPWKSLIGPLEGLHFLPPLHLSGRRAGGHHHHLLHALTGPGTHSGEDTATTYAKGCEPLLPGSPLAAVFRAAGWTPRNSAMHPSGGKVEMDSTQDGLSRSLSLPTASESALTEERERWNLITETLRQFVMDGILLPVMDKLSPAAATLLFQRHSHGGGVLKQERSANGKSFSSSSMYVSVSDARAGPPARQPSLQRPRNRRSESGGSQKGSPLLHALSIPAFDAVVLRRLQHPETYLVMVQFSAVLGLNENVAALIILDFHLKYLSDISYIVQQLEMEKNNTATPHLVCSHLQTMLYVVYDFIEKCENDVTIPQGPRRNALLEARRRLDLSSSFKSWLKLAVPKANPQSVYYPHTQRSVQDEMKFFGPWHPTVDKEEHETMSSYLARREQQLKVLEEGIDWFSPGELSVYTTLIHTIIKSHTPDTIDRLKSTLLRLKEVAFAIPPPLLASAGNVSGKRNIIQMFAPDITSLMEVIVSAI